jgi:hypothetical protein
MVPVTRNMTERQRHWAQAAQAEVRRGNQVTAALFALLSQPNDREKSASAGTTK